MQSAPRVADAMYDPAEPYERILNARGPITNITPEGTDNHFDRLWKKYTGANRYEHHRPDQTRVTVTISVEHATGKP